MARLTGQTFVVTGATGRQGSAVVRHLVRAGADVKAVTRDPRSKKARPIAALGVELVQADLEDAERLKAVFAGAAGVYSVQNPHTSSFEAEVRHGKNVAAAAKAAGVGHLVQGSAGFGQPTGIPSWDSKLEIEAHARSLGLPMTVLRPMAFMELMTDRAFYPMASTFHLMPKLMGAEKKVAWLALDDLGAVAARIFGAPDKYIGQDLRLASDLRSIEEVRALYPRVLGKRPPRFPMPEPLFRMFTGDDLVKMWRYLRTARIDVDPDETFRILPEAKTVEAWLAGQRGSGA